MKKKLILVIFLVFACILTACSAEQKQPEAPAVTEPAVTQPRAADIGGTEVDFSATRLDLEAAAFELEKLIGAAPELPDVNFIHLGSTELSAEEIARLQAAFPDAQIDYSVELFGQQLGKDAEYLDASAMNAEQTDELVKALAKLPMISEINFVSESGDCAYTVEQIPELDKVRQAQPGAYLRVAFDLFGQRVTSEDERIEYDRVEIGNEGLETVRSVLPYLKSCTYFLMDGCGVDDALMAQLREDFPETKIVWRIWLVEPDYTDKVALRAGSYLTDTHRVRTTYVNDENSHLLNYCTETKYLDVGHVWQLTQCEFLAYMPDLEVCIIAITEITDITPLANHEKLEYLELFTTDIEDISPLLTCPNIEHLNLSNMPKLKDITPVYSLKKLKRLRMVDSPYITREVMAEAARMLPDCEMLNHGHFATSWFWRKNEKGEYVDRYALLREQMEYEIDGKVYGIP